MCLEVTYYLLLYLVKALGHFLSVDCMLHEKKKGDVRHFLQFSVSGISLSTTEPNLWSRKNQNAKVLSSGPSVLPQFFSILVDVN